MIKQGHVHNWVGHFRFMERFGLNPCESAEDPVVVFGVYNANFINQHRAPITLVWTGNDTRMFRHWDVVKKRNVTSVTNLPRAQEYLYNKGVKCWLIKNVVEETPKTMKCGDKIYTYLNKHKPEYHGEDIVESLNVNQDILVGDFNVSPEDWRAGVADEYYSQAFVGLFLSDYCGGGTSIMEMGLRGRKVITNVLELPHCIPWRTKEDIERAIRSETNRIGKTSRRLADKVYKAMMPPQDGFDLEKLIVKDHTLNKKLLRMHNVHRLNL